MNKIIKITLLIFVMIGLGAIVVLFMSNIKDVDNVDIEATDFEKHIQGSVDCDIKGADYAQATAGFDNIVEEIETERFVTLNNNQHGISEESQQKCNKMAFFAYAPIFTHYSKSYFQQSSWSETILDSLKWRATFMLNMNIAEDDTDMYNQLKTTIKNVEDYYAILSLNDSSSKCTSVQSAKNMISEANDFKREPFTNNEILRTRLNNVPSNAKTSCATYIKNRCRYVANHYDEYGSYENFYSAYEKVTGLIDSYKNAFSNGNQFNEVISLLNSADNKAMEYYKEDNGRL